MWLSPEEAAGLWAEVVGDADLLPVRTKSGETVRRMCRDGSLEAAGVVVVMKPGRYYVERESLLEYIIRHCDEVAARGRKELEP